jgi:hypothetical protein
VGKVHIVTCAGASTDVDVYVSSDGAGETSVCPARGEDVAVTLTRGEEQRVIACEEMVIPPTGDGIATSIQVNVGPDFAIRWTRNPFTSINLDSYRAST